MVDKPKTAPAKAKKGSKGYTYSDEEWAAFMDEFEEHVACGGSTGSFWKRENTPSWSAFYKRMRSDLDFAKRYRRALTFRAIHRIEEVEAMTAQLQRGYCIVYDPNTGEEVGIEKMDMTSVRRLESAIKSHQWLAERENRAVFNPKNPEQDALESENKLSERLSAAENRLRHLDKKETPPED